MSVSLTDPYEFPALQTIPVIHTKSHIKRDKTWKNLKKGRTLLTLHCLTVPVQRLSMGKWTIYTHEAVNQRTPGHLRRLLLLAGDMESNPGPVGTKSQEPFIWEDECTSDYGSLSHYDSLNESIRYTLFRCSLL